MPSIASLVLRPLILLRRRLGQDRRKPASSDHGDNNDQIYSHSRFPLWPAEPMRVIRGRGTTYVMHWGYASRIFATLRRRAAPPLSPPSPSRAAPAVRGPTVFQFPISAARRRRECLGLVACAQERNSRH